MNATLRVFTGLLEVYLLLPCGSIGFDLKNKVFPLPTLPLHFSMASVRVWLIYWNCIYYLRYLFFITRCPGLYLFNEILIYYMRMCYLRYIPLFVACESLFNLVYLVYWNCFITFVTFSWFRMACESVWLSQYSWSAGSVSLSTCLLDV